LIASSSVLKTGTFLFYLSLEGSPRRQTKFSSELTTGIKPLVLKCLDELVMSYWRSASCNAEIEKCFSDAVVNCRYFISTLTCWNFRCFWL